MTSFLYKFRLCSWKCFLSKIQANAVLKQINLDQKKKGEYTMLLRKKVSFIKLGVFATFTALFIILGNASATFAQGGNMYEEPWHPASRFAVKEGGKRENATITLVKIKKADFTTGGAGLDFNICMEVTVKKGRKKAVKQYAQTNVFRDDNTMAYILKSWTLFKTPPDNCK